ncbi:MAG: zinc ribbon domain-containing protein [FCB group bacterium]|nr:zinc ribbon domain-containing protein [FCB group bacterium]
MPTYQYRCLDCSYEFEEFQAISDPPLTVCPVCHGKTERIITGGAGLIFKGSGFYITDHRSSQYKAEAAKENKSTAKPSKHKSPKESSKPPTTSPATSS